MSDKEDTLMPGHKLVADDGSGIEIAYKGPKNNDGKYLVSVEKTGKTPVFKRMTSADMYNPSALDRAKEILKNESKDVPFQFGRFTVTPGQAAKKPAAKKPAAKKSQGGKRRKTKRRKTRRKRKTRRRSLKRKRRTRRRRR